MSRALLSHTPFMFAWLVVGCPGEKSDDESDSGPAPVEVNYSPDAAIESSRFVDLKDGTLEDMETGLVWQRSVDDFKTSYDLAASYCRALSLADRGFRVPTKNELESLLEPGRVPAIDPIFPNTYLGYYWTSDTTEDGRVWAIRFDTGEAGILDPAVEYPRVRCVK